MNTKMFDKKLNNAPKRIRAKNTVLLYSSEAEINIDSLIMFLRNAYNITEETAWSYLVKVEKTIDKSNLIQVLIIVESIFVDVRYEKLIYENISPNVWVHRDPSYFLFSILKDSKKSDSFDQIRTNMSDDLLSKYRVKIDKPLSVEFIKTPLTPKKLKTPKNIEELIELTDKQKAKIEALAASFDEVASSTPIDFIKLRRLKGNLVNYIYKYKLNETTESIITARKDYFSLLWSKYNK